MRMFDARGLRGRRILLLIPHPDDEIVGCAAALHRATAAGAEFIGLQNLRRLAERDISPPA